MSRRLYGTRPLHGLALLFSLALLLLVPPRLALADDPDGAQLYGTYCSACHGKSGEGGLAPALTTETYLNANDDAAITLIIAAGKTGTAMPGWSKSAGGFLSDSQIDSIVAYLRSFAPAAAAAAPPAVTPEATPQPTAVPLGTWLGLTQSVNTGGARTITATLLDQWGEPVSGAVVAFSRATTFGVVDLGTARTDAGGNSSLVLGSAPTNAREVVAVFKGDGSWLASEARIVLDTPVAAAAAPVDAFSLSGIQLSIQQRLRLPEASLITPNPPLMPTALFALVVACIWSTYAYVVYQVYRIWRAGRSMPALGAARPSKQWRAMD